MTAVAPDSVLRLSAPPELTASNVAAFRDFTRAAILPRHVHLDLDMKKTSFIDSSGLGALISLHKLMTAQGGQIRLVHPSHQVMQILELTRMHRLMEIFRL